MRQDKKHEAHDGISFDKTSEIFYSNNSTGQIKLCGRYNNNIFIYFSQSSSLK